MDMMETKTVHTAKAGERTIHPKVMPLYQTSAFSFSSLEELEGYYEGNGTYLYSRTANPNTDALGETVANLEGAPKGVAASSGMSAILAGILAVVQAGDHVLAAQDVYGGTFHLLKEELVRLGIGVHFADFSNISEIEKSLIDFPEIKLLFSESITNPFLRIEDIEVLVQLKKHYGVKVMIDNTFATPYAVRPFELGADLVAHSATKYLGGHSDVTAGVLAGDKELIALAANRIVNMGMNLSPFEAWLTLRGIKTLSLRMKAQTANAQAIAEFLKDKAQVWYPGKGAIVTFALPESVDISKFFSSLGWIQIVPTLAGVETTVSYPYGTSHRALSEEDKEKIGVTRQVVRLSAGIEGTEDILAQLGAAFN
ncbi:PLP-dependent aspartate aminotransferase family protein [Planococcus liqunii]|uniref:PLP-dependent aspartate aminotransferase family protein n=1 Tax=Planococcus liqunii TaxID=3058394 RepID=A0ABT8MMS6_9BACL|nr:MULTISPECIES: PLP-dependent aspartate aminotransferase family protein [unclassified Planococcus (in: firmicutes)]MDN7226204.1 PLP-dependent aspartate aminotransferase family protein [Planococcus sp. N064]WKA49986.1 PLP-dependent aspartate aminotransferase family protein [Planococcus sp. N056]